VGKRRPRTFEAIKRLLCERLVLQRMNPDKPFVIRADASRYAVGAVLEQLAEGNGVPTQEDILGRKTVPVGFMSKKLTKTQRKCHSLNHILSNEPSIVGCLCELESPASFQQSIRPR
jgi:hypothetical protein